VETPFQRFMKSQIHKIDIDKWNEGKKTKHDPGSEYINEWIMNNADFFKKHWDVSKCKTCNNWETCGFKLLTKCKNYDRMAELVDALG